MVLLTLCILTAGLIGCCKCSQLPSAAASSITGECRVRKKKMATKSIIWTNFSFVVVVRLMQLNHVNN